MCPYSWRVPKNLNGTFRIVPKVDLGPVEFQAIESMITIRDGKISLPED